MESNKCDKCGSKITNTPVGCIHCETWKNINSIYIIAIVIRILLILATVIFLIAGIINTNTSYSHYSTTPNNSYMFYIYSAISLLAAFILPVLMKWCALVLNNLYEINQKTK